jgi:hypothetical protein
MSNSDAFVMRDASVTVDDVEYNDQVWVATLTPDVPITTQRTLVPDGSIVDVDSAVWTLALTFAQINTAAGLAKVLRTAEPGTEMDVVLVPDDTGVGSPQATCTIKTLPGPFGGTSGQLASNEMVLPVVGQPVFGVTS